MKDFFDKLNSLNIKDELEMESFFIKVEILLKTIKEDMISSFQNKQNTFSSIVEHQKDDLNYYESFYMISKERLDALKNTLTYLLIASKKYCQRSISNDKEIAEQNLLTEEFFQSIPLEYSDFIKNSHLLGELLLEQDVREVIIKNYQTTYPNSRTYDINKYAMEHLKQFKKIAPSKSNFKIKNYKKILKSLQHLSLLWFKIKDGDLENIRTSDIYMYQLCRVLLGE